MLRMQLPPATFLLSFLRALKITATGRLTKGPRLPSWSPLFELCVEALRVNSESLSALSIQAARASWDRSSSFDPAIKQVVRQPTTIAGIGCEWFRPTTSVRNDAQTLLYLHGGGYCIGSTDTHAGLIARLTLAHGGPTLGVNYRLAPEHKFPAALEDALAVYRGLLGSGQAPDRLIVGGDSAGGGLTLALLLKLRELGLPQPRAALLLCPWVDIMDSEGSVQRNAAYDWMKPGQPQLWAEYYLPSGHDGKAPLVSPLYADLTGLPPLMVQVGTAEMLYDQVLRFAQRAREAGVKLTLDEAQDMIHDWHLLAPFFPHCQAAIDRLAAFMRKPD